MLFPACLLLYMAVDGQEDGRTIHLEEVVIKSVDIRKSIYNPQQVSELTKSISTGKDLANQLKSLPGIQIRQSGASVSKPIIDGLSSSRLVYMVDGVKLENQDWADAHSIEIDPDLASNLSVLRGAESVKFGSNALGGVVSVDGGIIPKDKAINGSATLHYAGNTKGIGGHFKIQQNVDFLKGFRWRLSANQTKKGDYHTAKYNVTNSGTSLASYRAEVEYHIKNVEIEMLYSNYNSKQGNYFGALTGNIEEFEERIALGQPLVIYPYSFNFQVPYQESTHQIANAVITWEFARQWSVKSQYTYQKNHREEFDVRRSVSSSIPVQDMILSATHLNINLELKNKLLHSSLGFQIRNKENYNKPGTGVVPALPNYIYQEESIYTHHTLSLNQWVLNAGLRYDWTLLNAQGINFLGQKYSGNNNYSALSSQVAAKFSTDHWDFNSSLSYGWRIPESYELYANGKQHGIPIYYVGNKDMSAEKGLKWMNAIGFKVKNSTFELQGFINSIKNYIYAVPSHEYKQLFSGPAAIFQFKQRDALLCGIDLIHSSFISPKLEFKNRISWIEGKEIESKSPLPNISPIMVNNHLIYQFPAFGKFEDSSIQVGHEWVGKKTSFNPDYELSSQTPSAYHVVNMAVSTRQSINQRLGVRMTASVDNLFNTLYKDYLNLHRYFVHDSGRSINVSVQFNF